MSNSVYSIDWVEPARLFDPFVAGKGGVVVLHGAPESACNTFRKVIRNQLREKPGAVTIELSPVDEASRSASDILAKLYDKFGMDEPVEFRTSVATDLTAGRDILLTDVTVNVGTEGFAARLATIARAKKVVQAIELRLNGGRAAFFLNDWNELPKSVRQWFWDDFLGERLDWLLENGLLIVCTYETPDGIHDHDGATPALAVRLPSMYDGEDRSQALTDIAALATEHGGYSHEEAHIVAETLLNEWSSVPALVHSRIIGQLISWQSRRG